MSILDCTEAFAVPGEGHIVDCIRPNSDPKISWHSGETLGEIRLRYPLAEVVNIEEWSKKKGALQDSPVTWGETTKERYLEMLEVLPPAYQVMGGFLVGEASDHHAITGLPRFAAYRSGGNKYWVASRPMTIHEMKALNKWNGSELE